MIRYKVHPIAMKLYYLFLLVLLANSSLLAQLEKGTWMLNGRFEMINHIWQIEIGQSICIIGQKHFFSIEIFSDSHQAGSDIGMNTSVNESYSPIVNIRIE